MSIINPETLYERQEKEKSIARVADSMRLVLFGSIGFNGGFMLAHSGDDTALEPLVGLLAGGALCAVWVLIRNLRMRRRHELELWEAGDSTRAPFSSSKVFYLLVVLETGGPLIGAGLAGACYGMWAWLLGRALSTDTLAFVLIGGFLVGVFGSWGLIDIISGCARRMKRKQQKE